MKKSTFILDCDIDELLKTISHYLEEFDDGMKSAAAVPNLQAAQFISDSIDKLSKLYRQFKKTGKASKWDRNTARMLIKETIKIIVVEVTIPSDHY